MKEEVLRVPLRGIIGLRIKCANCGGSVELPLSEIGNNARVVLNGKCMICGYAYEPQQIGKAFIDPIVSFVRCLDRINGIDPKIEIEGIIPPSSDDPA